MILNIYSWNVLNPQPHISQMSWTSFFIETINPPKEVKGRLSIPVPPKGKAFSTKKSFEIATIDYERYKLYRIFILIKIIKYWIRVAQNDLKPTIICLQEVNLDLLDKLKVLVSANEQKGKTSLNLFEGQKGKTSLNLFEGQKGKTSLNLFEGNKQICWSNDTDSNYRVTIVINCEIINSKEIIFPNLSKGKSVLLSNIKIKNKIYQCFNVHFHWSWTLIQLDYVATIIKNIIDESLPCPFIIVGDFNKPIDLLESFMDQFDCIQFNKQTNGKECFASLNLCKGYTSMLTHIKDSLNPKKGIIDHILLSSDFITDKKTKLKIISNVFKYKIFYNFNKIILIKNLTSQKWIDKRKNKDISDHKPVNLEISI